MGLEIINKRNEEDAYLFKRSIRKLLDATFIVADKDEKLYDFIAAESNHYDVNTYLSLIGYQVMVDDRLKVAMLQQHVKQNAARDHAERRDAPAEIFVFWIKSLHKPSPPIAPDSACLCL